jgi:hypothetical protein
VSVVQFRPWPPDFAWREAARKIAPKFQRPWPPDFAWREAARKINPVARLKVAIAARCPAARGQSLRVALDARSDWPHRFLQRANLSHAIRSQSSARLRKSLLKVADPPVSLLDTRPPGLALALFSAFVIG